MRSEVYFIAGLLLMTILAFISRCGGDGVQNRHNSDTVVTVKRSVDTIVDTVNRFITDTIKRLKRTTDTVRDTAYIVQDYQTYTLTRHSFQDSLLDATITTGIWQNSLDSLSLNYSLLRERKTITKTVAQTPAWSLWAGTSTSFQGFVPNIAYKRDGHQFQVGYDVVQQLPVVGYQVRFYKP
jgi:hypothetical protein